MCKILNLFTLMQERKVSQKQLSEAIGFSSGNISDWKTGRSSPGIDALLKIADYFNVSVDYLLGIDTKYNKDVLTVELSDDKKRLLEMYDMLTDMEKGEILGELKVLTHSKYIAVPVAARHDSGKTYTESMSQDEIEDFKNAKAQTY